MMDWADEIANLLKDTNFLAVSDGQIDIIAQALRNARAVGIREAAEAVIRRRTAQNMDIYRALSDAADAILALVPQEKEQDKWAKIEAVSEQIRHLSVMSGKATSTIELDHFEKRISALHRYADFLAKGNPIPDWPKTRKEPAPLA